MLNLRIGDKVVCVHVHALVLQAFTCFRPSPMHMARHLDGDRKNNCIENLKWGTHAENTEDCIKHGSLRGERSGRATITENTVRAAKAMFNEGISTKEVARRLGCKYRVIYNVRAGKSWTHVTDVVPQ